MWQKGDATVKFVRKNGEVAMKWVASMSEAQRDEFNRRISGFMCRRRREGPDSQHKDCHLCADWDGTNHSTADCTMSKLKDEKMTPVA